MNDVKILWDIKFTDYENHLNIEKQFLMDKRWRYVEMMWGTCIYWEEKRRLKKKLDRRFEKFVHRLEIKKEKVLSDLMNKGKNCFVRDNLVISVMANKMMILKITDSLLRFIPSIVTENILEYLSLSFVWSMFFERVGPKLARRIRLIFKNNHLSNITMSGLHPTQFCLIGLDGDNLKKSINFKRLPTRKIL